jgi:hypothetical protein
MKHCATILLYWFILITSLYYNDLPAQTYLSRSLSNQAPFIVRTENNAQLLWDSLHSKPLPAGISISSIVFNGSYDGVGIYENFPQLDSVHTAYNGILLSTGKITNVVLSPATDTTNMRGDSLNTSGSPSIEKLINGNGNTYKSYDAAQFHINFKSDSTVTGFSFEFIFASNEFPFHITQEFSDVFAVFLNDSNIAVDSSGKLISCTNTFFKIDNRSRQIPLFYNGLTPILKTSVTLRPGNHRLSFVISDIGDKLFNSTVFLNNFSFTSSGNGTDELGLLVDNQSFTITDTLQENSLIGTIATSVTNRLQKYFKILSTQAEFTINRNSGYLLIATDASLTTKTDTIYNLPVELSIPEMSLKDTSFVTIKVKKPLLKPHVEIVTAAIDSVKPLYLVTIESNAPNIFFTTDNSQPDTTQPSQKYLQPTTLELTNTLTVIRIKIFGDRYLPLDTSVTLTNMEKLLIVKNAAYLDTNANGAIDGAVVELFVKNYDLPLPVSLINPFSRSEYKIKSVKIDSSGNNIYILTFSIIETVFEGSTYFIPDSFGTIMPSPSKQQKFLITDFIAPVIKRAQLMRDQENHLIRFDTLKVVISEGFVFKQMYNHFFTFTRSNQTFSLEMNFLKQNNDSAWFIIESANGNSVFKYGDKIRLNNLANFADFFSNVQGRDQNRDVVLEFNALQSDITVISAPNPFTPGNNNLFSNSMRQNFPKLFLLKQADASTMISVSYPQSMELLLHNPGKVIIFDALGNRIRKELPLQNGIAPNSCGTLWNGFNDHGRIVGSGTYLALVKLNEKSGLIITRKILIGVKR